MRSWPSRTRPIPFARISATCPLTRSLSNPLLLNSCPTSWGRMVIRTLECTGASFPSGWRHRHLSSPTRRRPSRSPSPSILIRILILILLIIQHVVIINNNNSTTRDRRHSRLFPKPTTAVPFRILRMFTPTFLTSTMDTARPGIPFLPTAILRPPIGLLSIPIPDVPRSCQERRPSGERLWTLSLRARIRYHGSRLYITFPSSTDVQHRHPECTGTRIRSPRCHRCLIRHP